MIGRSAQRRSWRVFSLSISAWLGLTACALSPDRLPELDRRFYYNLETPKDKQSFLKLEDSERQAFLQQKGLWQKWTALSSEERDAVTTGEIKVGFQEFAVYMAFGPPADSREIENGQFQTYIRCTSGPKVGVYVRNNLDCDGTSTETLVTMTQGRVTEIKHPD